MYVTSLHFFDKVFWRQCTIPCPKVAQPNQNSQHIVIGYGVWRIHLSCVFCVNTQRYLSEGHRLQPSRRRWQVVSFLHNCRSQCGLMGSQKYHKQMIIPKLEIKWNPMKVLVLLGKYRCKLHQPYGDFARASAATTFVLAITSAATISRMIPIFGSRHQYSNWLLKWINRELLTL